MGNVIQIKNDVFELLNKMNYLYNRIPIIWQLTPNFEILDNIDIITEYVESKVPDKKIKEVRCISISNIEEFNKLNVDSYYKNKVIYLSPNIQNIQTFSSNLIYELVKIIINYYNYYIMNDGLVEKEFIYKRLKLYYNLLNLLPKDQVPNIDLFVNSEYNKDLYSFFYRNLKSETLNEACKNLFLHINSVLSLNLYCVTILYILLAQLRKENDVEFLHKEIYNKCLMFKRI